MQAIHQGDEAIDGSQIGTGTELDVISVLIGANLFEMLPMA